jgi:sensor domain CHASE-containing protein
MKPSNHKGRSFIRRLLLPTIVGLTSLAAVLVLWQRLITQQRTKVQVVTSSEILFVKNKIESELESRILPLEQLARRWQVRGEPDDVDWSSDTALAMSGSRGFQAIEWVDPMFRVRLVAPQTQKNAELGSNFHSDVRRRVVLEAVAEKGVTLVSRSVELKTGGRGFLVCVPIFSNRKFQAAVVGVFNYQELLDPILKDVAQDDWLAIYENPEKIYSRAGDSVPSEEALAFERPCSAGPSAAARNGAADGLRRFFAERDFPEETHRRKLMPVLTWEREPPESTAARFRPR